MIRVTIEAEGLKELEETLEQIIAIAARLRNQSRVTPVPEAKSHGIIYHCGTSEFVLT
jgi:hypothetical protein